MIEDIARKAVEGKRQADYGSPAVNHARTAGLVSAYLYAKYGEGKDNPEFMVEGVMNLTPQDVCVMNILQKISRLMHNPTEDGYIDIIGYVINWAKIEGMDEPSEGTDNEND